ncbi:DMT family transporter [Pseudomonas schmalbachii]|uniref:DMT family transporter n=1 Tax=Pseudomonas schmalbachii TaxID=2816993 RepID=A0ABS3TL02_9PSED|nr:DMT family transporter [Pseudomonas schmalbachii]MBO3274329.1 DMT family transporter [Pseudomonas schmalbachii]
MHTHSLSRRNGHAMGFCLVLLAAFCYGLQPFFARFAYAGGADPVGLLLARFSIAAGILLVWLRWRGIPLPSGRLARQNLLLGVGYGLAALGYYSAARSTSVSLAITLVYTFPAFVTALSITCLGERTSALKLASLALAVGGVVIATGLDLSGASLGALWALFAAVCYGSSIIYGTHRIVHENPLASAAMLLLGCALTFTVAAVVQGASLPATAPAWWGTAGLALFATLVPVAAFLAGSPRIGPSAAATLSTLEPMVAVSIAVLFMGEHVTSAMLGGGAMVLLAAIFLAHQGAADRECAPVPGEATRDS